MTKFILTKPFLKVFGNIKKVYSVTRRNGPNDVYLAKEFCFVVLNNLDACAPVILVKIGCVENQLDPVQTSCLCRAELDSNKAQLYLSMAETQLWFRRHARVLLNSRFTEATHVFPRNSLALRNRNSTQIHWIKFMNFVWCSRIPAVTESCSTAELVKLNCLRDVIQKFELNSWI